MTLTKSLLLGSSATLVAVAGAQAADLPSKKAAPATYVKVCDAYGAGFFVIPGTDTCVKIGGYVRAEYQYVAPQATSQLVFSSSTKNRGGVSPTLASAGTNAIGVVSSAATGDMGTVYNILKSSSVPTTTGVITAGNGMTRWDNQTAAGITATAVGGYQSASTGSAYGSLSSTNKMGSIVQADSANSLAQATAGYEIRGRIDVDARTATSMGPARTFVRLRLANTSGVRNTSIANNTGYTNSVASTTGATLETASIQWAGFTFGVAPENYAMMPSAAYNANPWTGFPNGMKQIAYTASLGGGLSATIALEDAKDMNNPQTNLSRGSTTAWAVGNIRLDQSWGFAAIHGMVGNNSVQKNWTPLTWVAGGMDGNGVEQLGGYYYVAPFAGFNAPPSSSTLSTGETTKMGYAVGATVNFKLPMIAPGDQVWLTANYTDGALTGIMSSGGLSNIATASNKRLLGGLVRVDSNLQVTGLNTFDTVKAWNVAAAMTHYWAAQWRSQLSAGYMAVNTPTAAAGYIQWGDGNVQVYTGSLVYSPVKDLDIGLETQYAKASNKVQNWSTGAPALTGLNPSNWTTKLRVERTF